MLTSYTMPLHHALKEHKSKEALTAIENGADVNVTQNDLNLLQLAAGEGLQEIVLALLVRNVSVNQALGNTETPLFLAYENNHEIIIQVLLACGASQASAGLQHIIFNVNPAIMRGLLFWAIRNTKIDGVPLIELLQPQMEKQVDSMIDVRLDAEEKNDNMPLQNYFQVEIFSLLNLCLKMNKVTAAQKLMEIAKNIHATWRHSERTPAPDDSTLTEKISHAFYQKDYVTLDSLLKMPEAKTDELLKYALSQHNHDLASFLIVVADINLYDFALSVVQDETVFQNVLAMPMIAESLLYQVVSRNTNRDILPTQKERQLFERLPQDSTIKSNQILQCVYSHSQEVALLPLLTSQEPMFARIKPAELSIPIYSLLVESFTRFNIDLQSNIKRVDSGDRKLPDVLWQCVFINLSRDEQQEVNRTSRYFHRLMIDPKGKNQRKVDPLQRKLHTVNHFMDEIEKEMAAIAFFQLLNRLDLLQICLIPIMLGIFFASKDWFDDYFQKLQKLEGIKCERYYVHHYLNSCDDDVPESCKEACHEIATVNGFCATVFGFVVGEVFNGALFFPNLISLIVRLCNIDNRKEKFRLDRFSETIAQLARAMFAENPASFQGMTLGSPAGSVLPIAKELKTKYEKELADILLAQEDLPSFSLPHSPSASRLGLFSEQSVSSLDADEAHEYPSGYTAIEMTDMSEEKEALSRAF